MRHAENRKRPKKSGLPAEIEARIVKSLFFRGLAIILVFLAYTGILRTAEEERQDLRKGQEAVEAGTGAAPASEAILPEKTGMAAQAEPPEKTEITAQAEPPEKTGIIAQAEPSEKTEMAAQAEPPEKTEIAAQAEPSEKTGVAVRTDASGMPDPATQEDPEQRRVALTFDDGPHPVYTGRLLDGLKERNVKATFFVIGENIPGNEELIRRMDREGHLIGNHTYDHVKISDLSAPEACEQIEKTSSLIREITGNDTEFVRPPFGEWNKDMECTFVMIPVLWDVDPMDWLTKNVSDIVRKVLEDTKNGDIILLHDCYDSSVEAALEIVDRLKEQGYEFVTVDELILE